MAQASLRFGSINICSPSNGLDGYAIIDHDVTKVEFIEIDIKNTAGRVKQIIGVGSTERTSFKLQFKCQRCFASDATLGAFLTQVQTACANSRTNLATVYYGLMNGTSVFSQTNCDMMFKLDRVWQSHDGWWADFNVVFSKWSV